MNMIQAIVCAVLVISLLCAVLLLAYTLRQRQLLATRYFFVLVMTSILYTFGYLMQINAASAQQARIWYYVQYLVIPFQPYLWLMMTLEYLEVDRKFMKKAEWIALYHPILYMLIFYTNPLHKAYVTSSAFRYNGYFYVWVTQKGILFWGMVVSGTMICIFCVVVYLYYYFASPREHRIGVLTLLLTLLPPWFAVYFTASRFNTLRLDYLPVAAVISAILYVVSVLRFRMFQFMPIAYEKIFQRSPEGILLTDITGRIVDVNPSFCQLFPELKGGTKRKMLEDFLSQHPELDKQKMQKEELIFEKWLQQNCRFYRAGISALYASNGKKMGEILTVTDVTLLVEHQKNLEDAVTTAREEAKTSELSFLQAQIKPHFLNNTLSVIGAMITRNPLEARALIAELGEHLANCYYFDSTSPMTALEKELESVQTYVNIEQARFRERIGYRLECGEIPDMQIPRLVLEPLVENAIRHGILKKSGKGYVTLSIEKKGNCVCFSVRDDGVGMSRETIRAILGQEGKEHSIGISNIHKRLRMHYGRGLSIKSVPGAGTVVSFCVPGKEKGERNDFHNCSGR